MKSIKKYMTSLAAAGFVMAVAVPGHASFTSKPPLQVLSAGATTGGTATIAIVSAVIKNISDNGTVAAIGWTGALPGGGWKVADQYVQMVTNITTNSGGVQYYTDNTNAAASPKFTGVVNNTNPTPAGLVDSVDTTQKLSTAWRASATLVSGITASDPNNASDPNSFLWFFHEDKAQVAVPSLNAAAFVNADPFVTMYAAPGTILTGQSTAVSGLHFAQGPTQFGGFSSTATTDIYTEADFTGALAQRAYSTNRLILEAFSL